MKHVQTHTFLRKVNNSFDKSHNFFNIIVEEYKTFYSVFIHIVGYEFPSLYDFRVSKKSAKSPYEAYNFALQCYLDRKYI